MLAFQLLESRQQAIELEIADLRPGIDVVQAVMPFDLKAELVNFDIPPDVA